jgi:hypothetical protein
VLRLDSHGKTKVRVKADASDASEPQVSVHNASDVQKFSVDEAGNVAAAGRVSATGPVLAGTYVQSVGGRFAGGNGVSPVFGDGDNSLMPSDVQIAASNADPDIVENALEGLGLGAVNSILGMINALARATLYRGAVNGTTPGVISGCAVTAGAGLTANVASGVVFSSYTSDKSSLTGLALTDNATNYVYFNGPRTSRAFLATTTLSTATQNQNIPLAAVTTSAGAVTAVKDVRRFVKYNERKAALVVSDDANVYGFATLNAAIDHLHLIDTTSREVVVRGTTTITEQVSITRAGIDIRGEGNAKLAWSHDGPAIVVSASRVAIEGLQFAYTRTAATTSQQACAISIDTSSAGLQSIRIRKCTALKNSGTNRTRGFLYAAGGNNLRYLEVLDCHDVDAGGAPGSFTDYGIVCESPTLNASFARVCFKADTAGIQGPEANAYGLELQSAVNCTVDGCTFDSFAAGGVLVWNDAAKIRNSLTNVVVRSAGVNKSGGANRYAIEIGERTHVLGCHLHVNMTGIGGGSSAALRTNGDYNILIGNQYGSFGSSHAAAGTQTEANNRDE